MSHNDGDILYLESDKKEKLLKKIIQLDVSSTKG